MSAIEDDIQAYAKGMRAGDSSACIRVEQKYDLYGLPPQLVSECLSAILKGESVDDVFESWGG